MEAKKRTPKNLGVLLIDFNPVVRGGLQAILGMDYAIELIPDAADADQALLQLKQASDQGRPVNVVLTETRTSTLDGMHGEGALGERRTGRVAAYSPVC